MPNLKTSRARALRRNPTDTERHLWRHLRKRQLHNHKFRRQYPIGPYIVDFACLEKRLAIELDGGQHADQKAYDRKRDEFIRDTGFTILRFWNHQVFQETEAVLDEITRHLSSPPHSSP